MSDVDDFIAEVDKEEELRMLYDEKYLAEQDKKLEELQKKISELQVQNEKHIKTIMTSLDDLVENKKLIQETLDQVGNMPDLDISGPLDSINLSVAELLSKVTGFASDTEELTKLTIPAIDDISKDVKYDDLMTDGDTNIDNTRVIEIKHNKSEKECEIENETKHIKKSETEIPKEKCVEKDIQSLQENTCLSEDSCTKNSNTAVPDGSEMT